MSKSRRPKRLQRRVRALRSGTLNALELLRQGRLGAPYKAPHEVIYQSERYNLRHYETSSQDPTEEIEEMRVSSAINLLDRDPILLIPPLMVTSEIYDIAPELSAISALCDQGTDVWLVDFGPPEDVDGGMLRTLDDHILAVDDAITRIHTITQRNVHIAGYSQGGMFAYQAAAYRKSANIASVITFGSPVDIHRNLPVRVHTKLAGHFIRAASSALSKPIQKLDGLPAEITSRGFKLLSPRKELQQLIGLARNLHDRDALKEREPRRAFLGGDGFVSWPGPAFRDFFDQVIVDNRLARGGFIVDGQTVSLRDITCPILCFVGSRDDLARPESVRAIHSAAPQARIEERTIAAGHFGLVVGSRALSEVWPSVMRWIASNTAEHLPPTPDDEPHEDTRDSSEDLSPAPQTRPLYDLVTHTADTLWQRLGDVSLQMTDVVDVLQWQLPRLARLESITPDTCISPALALQDQADTIPDATFFIWKGRAFSYEQVNFRVDQFAHALLEAGVQPSQRVALFTRTHPDTLTALVALNRIGAVCAVLDPNARGEMLRHLLHSISAHHIITDAPHIDLLAPLSSSLLTIGAHPTQAKASNATPLETLLPEHPSSFTIPTNAMRASETALLVHTRAATTTLPRPAIVTNGRWASSSLTCAAMARLSPSDTVLCAPALHHPTGLLAAIGGSLVGGCRLALPSYTSTRSFWTQVHRDGVTVVFHTPDLCAAFLENDGAHDDRRNPLRLLAGHGLPKDLWEALQKRIPTTKIVEFYGSVEGNVLLVNLSGEKPGSTGQRPGFGPRLALVLTDPEHPNTVLRTPQGHTQRPALGEPGELIARIDNTHPLTRFEGYADALPNDTLPLLRDVFTPGDVWFRTGDRMHRDEDGDYWYHPHSSRKDHI